MTAAGRLHCALWVLNILTLAMSILTVPEKRARVERCFECEGDGTVQAAAIVEGIYRRRPPRDLDLAET